MADTERLLEDSDRDNEDRHRWICYLFFVIYPINLACRWYLVYFLSSSDVDPGFWFWVLVISSFAKSIIFLLKLCAVYQDRLTDDSVFILWFVDIPTIACFVYFTFTYVHLISWAQYVKAVKTIIVSIIRFARRCLAQESTEEDQSCEDFWELFAHFALMACSISMGIKLLL